MDTYACLEITSLKVKLWHGWVKLHGKLVVVVDVRSGSKKRVNADDSVFLIPQAGRADDVQRVVVRYDTLWNVPLILILPSSIGQKQGSIGNGKWLARRVLINTAVISIYCRPGALVCVRKKNKSCIIRNTSKHD